MPQLSFLPDPQRAKQLNRQMCRQLATSLEHLHSQTSAYHTIPQSQLSRFVRDINKSEKVSPAVFAIYYDILIATLEENYQEIHRLFSRLLATKINMPPFSITTLSPTTLGDMVYHLYVKYADNDTDAPIYLTEPEASEAEKLKALITDALELLSDCAPELCDEFHEIVSQVVIATSANNDDGILFQGASSVYLWGTLFINTDSHGSVMQVLNTLIHESSHSLLFALSMNEPLTRNTFDDRYESPLRADSRPMDGIYHATFVLARMTYGMNSVIDSDKFPQHMLPEANELINQSRALFREGYASVTKSADLTPTGEEIMSHTYQYMST